MYSQGARVELYLSEGPIVKLGTIFSRYRLIIKTNIVQSVSPSCGQQKCTRQYTYVNASFDGSTFFIFPCFVVNGNIILF